MHMTEPYKVNLSLHTDKVHMPSREISNTNLDCGVVRWQWQSKVI